MQFDVRTGETYSMHGVPLQVDGVCMVKVDPSDEGIQLAAEEFLSRGRDDIARTAQQAVEGHLRAAVGAHSIEDVYRDRAGPGRQDQGALRSRPAEHGARHRLADDPGRSPTSRATWRRSAARAPRR